MHDVQRMSFPYNFSNLLHFCFFLQSDEIGKLHLNVIKLCIVVYAKKNVSHLQTYSTYKHIIQHSGQITNGKCLKNDSSIVVVVVHSEPLEHLLFFEFNSRNNKLFYQNREQKRKKIEANGKTKSDNTMHNYEYCFIHSFTHSFICDFKFYFQFVWLQLLVATCNGDS